MRSDSGGLRTYGKRYGVWPFEVEESRHPALLRDWNLMVDTFGSELEEAETGLALIFGESWLRGRGWDVHLRAVQSWDIFTRLYLWTGRCLFRNMTIQEWWAESHRRRS